ncbi:DGQHR domain-containing protein [Arcicella sp. LKC2W]|uniref:DGQHR domain-containing protein n=1 Tax=Arcicella sp. LKC2W TaxID=2984198 RepID=UPI002B1EB32A|nr:DGQHR domain-containing protein [Arcicella sp. LKC2W]MEA5459852.1 DGQHR domain-containing protein [Arcicella sp. LKC2W]
MMTNLNNNILLISCQEVKQNSVDFFLGKIKVKELIELVSVTSRAITGFNDSGEPLYNNNDYIQREPNSSRVNSIKNYLLTDEDACFPNNILISVPSILLAEEVKNSDLEYDESHIFTLKIDKNRIDLTSTEAPLYLQIFDGQHRFRGIQLAIQELRQTGSNDQKLKELEEFEFVVSFFIEAEIEFQAMLFSIINRTPVKVSQDLVYDLFGLTIKDSPQKTALAIVLQLNGLREKEDGKVGPFYRRIRLLSRKEKGFDSPISQGIFIKQLLKLISPSLSKADQERLSEREQLLTGGNNRTIFRQWYATNKDNNIYKTLLNYFIAVRETFVDKNGNSYWDFEYTPDNALQRTIGFTALIEILILIFPDCLKEKNISVEFFKKYLQKAKDIKLVGEERPYPFTSIGGKMLKDDLERLIFNS